jgi:uncharacterized protein YcbK (DUF882 family)
MRGFVLVVLTALLILTGTSTTSEAAPAGKKVASSKRSKKVVRDPRYRTPAGSVRQCSGSGKSKKCRRVAMFSGHNAAKSTLRTDPLGKPSGDVWLRAESLNEEVRVNIYKKDGSYDDAALAKLDDLFRCIRTGEVRAVRAELYEHLSRIYDHFGGKRVDLVSGFRFAERNSSRHFHASAMDIRIKGVSIHEMKKYAETLDGGNMGIGIYPTSGFVHVDFRAPGEPSFRWTDWSGPSGGKRGKKSKKKSPGRTTPARKPVS